jgi:PKD repeat protein
MRQRFRLLLAGLGFVCLAAGFRTAAAAPMDAANADVALASVAASRAEAVSPPMIDAPATVAAATDRLLTITATATDPDAADILTITASGAPASLAFSHTPSVSPAPATFSGTPGAGDIGSWTILWTVSDGTFSASASTSLTVVANSPPVVTAPATVPAAASLPLSFAVFVSDPDGDDVTSLTAAPLPTGATFTANALLTTGGFNWTPTVAQQGNYLVTFTSLSGSPALTGSATTQIQVGPEDLYPVITFPATTNGRANHPITFVANCSDPNGEAITEFKITGTQNAPLPAGATFTVNPTNTSLTFTWTPTQAQLGTFNFWLRATDAEPFPLQTPGERYVARIVVSPDRAPAVTAPAAVSGFEGTPLTFTVSASDPDGDAVASLSAAPLLAGSFFTAAPDNLSGAFAWTPDYTQAGTYTVVFTASNALSGTASTVITVNGVSQCPAVSAPATVSTDEGALLTFTVSATDADGEPVTLTAIGAPLGSTFTDNGDNTGTFSWTPTFTQAGLHSVTFRGSDGHPGCNGSSVAVTSITVNNVNRAPVADANGPYTGVAGVPLAFDGSASSDPDGDPISHAWDFGDGLKGGGAMSSHTYASGGLYTVTLTVTDTGSPALSASATTTATITSVFDARVCTTNANATLKLNSGKQQWCAQIEPVGGDFAASDVVLSSIVLQYGGQEIHVAFGKSALVGDTDKNGVSELQACFAKSDLRVLFAGLPSGRNTVTARIEGRLTNGALIRGDVIFDVVASGGALAASLSPNPLNPRATLSFVTRRPGALRVQVYDLNGRMARTLVDEPGAGAGSHDVSIDGLDDRGVRLASGVYFFRIESADGSTTGRFSILK